MSENTEIKPRLAILQSRFIQTHAVREARNMPSTQNNPSPGANPGETRLDSALDDYLLAKSKANETGNYRRNAERVLSEFLDWADEQDIETFDALDVADLEAYALSPDNRRGRHRCDDCTQVLRLRARRGCVLSEP